jgi:DNA-3-methyladenine glycosylase II
MTKRSVEQTAEWSYTPRGPFSLAWTSARFGRLPDPVNRVAEGEFARLVPAGEGLALVRVAQERATKLRLRVAWTNASSEAARAAATRLVEAALGARLDLRPFQRAHAGDPLLGPAMRAHRGLRVAGAFDLFEALVNAVLTQQVNLQFAYSVRAELAERYGASAELAGARWLAFPTAERIARANLADLRGMRLSQAKAETLLRVARACAEGELTEAMLAPLSDEDAIAALVRTKGIGRWTAEVALIRGLGRPDVFPAGDLAVLRRLAPDWLGRAASEAEIRAFAERWRPWRSLALVYFFESLAARPKKSSGRGGAAAGRAGGGPAR